MAKINLFVKCANCKAVNRTVAGGIVTCKCGCTIHKPVVEK